MDTRERRRKQLFGRGLMSVQCALRTKQYEGTQATHTTNTKASLNTKTSAATNSHKTDLSQLTRQSQTSLKHALQSSSHFLSRQIPPTKLNHPTQKQLFSFRAKIPCSPTLAHFLARIRMQRNKLPTCSLGQPNSNATKIPHSLAREFACTRS